MTGVCFALLTNTFQAVSIATFCLQGGGYLALSGIPDHMLFGRHDSQDVSDTPGPTSISNVCPDPDFQLDYSAAIEDEAAVNGSSFATQTQYKFDVHIVYHRSYQQAVLFFRAYNMGEPLASRPIIDNAECL